MVETSLSGQTNMHTLVWVYGAFFASKGYSFKNIFEKKVYNTTNQHR